MSQLLYLLATARYGTSYFLNISTDESSTVGSFFHYSKSLLLKAAIFVN